MKRIVWDQPDRVMQFVAARTGEESYRDFTAIGLESGGKLVAGVVFEQHNGPNIFMAVASNGSRHWMTPAYLSACFRYPFLVLKTNRISGLVRADNFDAQRFDEAIGFRREGIVRRGASDGTDLILYGMLQEECRFLGGRYQAALRQRVQ